MLLDLAYAARLYGLVRCAIMHVSLQATWFELSIAPALRINPEGLFEMPGASLKINADAPSRGTRPPRTARHRAELLYIGSQGIAERPAAIAQRHKKPRTTAGAWWL